MILKKEFYFVRHGETDYKKTITTPHHDLPLNATGKKQAHQIETIIAGLPIATICFSPLRRAQETKEIISLRLQAPHCEIMELTECSSEIWRKMTSTDRWSPNDPVQQFIQTAIKGINQALLQPGPVLIVAHGGIYWAMCSCMNIDQHWLIDHCIPARFSVGDKGQWIRDFLVE